MRPPPPTLPEGSSAGRAGGVALAGVLALFGSKPHTARLLLPCSAVAFGPPKVRIPRGMGFPHGPNASTLGIAMLLDTEIVLIRPAAPFISQRGPTDPSGGFSVRLAQRPCKLVNTVTV